MGVPLRCGQPCESKGLAELDEGGSQVLLWRSRQYLHSLFMVWRSSIPLAYGLRVLLLVLLLGGSKKVLKQLPHDLEIIANLS